MPPQNKVLAIPKSKAPTIPKPQIRKRPRHRKNCWIIWMLLVLPVIVIMLGMLLRNITTDLIIIPTSLLLGSAGVFVLLFIIFLLYPIWRGTASTIALITVVILCIIAVITSTLLIADLTKAWPDLWVWLSVTILLAVFVATSGAILGAYLGVSCTESRILQLGPASIKIRSVSGKGVLQPVRDSFEDKDAAQAKLITSLPAGLKVPARWPENLVYSPLKFTGPYARPQFKDIQILLVPKKPSAPSMATTFFGDYFEEIATNPPNHVKALYRLYFGNSIFESLAGKHPPDPTPGTSIEFTVKTRIDSGNKNQTHALGILLQLKRLSYTSRYGGSIRLDFEMVEDYFYEFFCPSNGAGKGPYFYDLSRLQMSVFIKVLKFRPANQTPRFIGASGMFVEFHPRVEGVYSGTESGGMIFPALAPALSGEQFNEAVSYLHEQLSEYSTALVSLAHLGSFTLGFLHNELRDTQLTGDFIVEQVAISDGEIQIWTRQAQYFLTIHYSVRHVKLDTELGKEEVRLALKGAHSFYTEPGDRGYRTHDYIEGQKMKAEGRRSSLYHIATLPISEIYVYDPTTLKPMPDGSFGDGTPRYKIRGRLPFVFERVCTHHEYPWEYDSCRVEGRGIGFWFKTSVLVWEEDPVWNDFFYDYEEAYPMFEHDGSWDVVDALHRWIERKWPVIFRPSVHPFSPDDKPFDAIIHEAIFQRSESMVWKEFDVVLPLGGPGHSEARGGALTKRIRVAIHRR